MQTYTNSFESIYKELLKKVLPLRKGLKRVPLHIFLCFNFFSHGHTLIFNTFSQGITYLRAIAISFQIIFCERILVHGHIIIFSMTSPSLDILVIIQFLLINLALQQSPQ